MSSSNSDQPCPLNAAIQFFFLKLEPFAERFQEQLYGDDKTHDTSKTLGRCLDGRISPKSLRAIANILPCRGVAALKSWLESKDPVPLQLEVDHPAFKTDAATVNLLRQSAGGKISVGETDPFPFTNYDPWANSRHSRNEPFILQYYFQTREDDKLIWMYVPLKFLGPATGLLRCETTISDGNRETYCVSAQLLNTLLVLVAGRRQPDALSNAEDLSISLFWEYLLGRRNDVFAGVAWNEDNHRISGLGACLLAEEPIVEASPGRIVDADTIFKLDERWHKRSEKLNRVLPLLDQSKFDEMLSKRVFPEERRPAGPKSPKSNGRSRGQQKRRGKK